VRFGILSLPRTVQSAIDEAKLAEDVGFDWFGVADSQSVYRELYTTLASCAGSVRRIKLGPTVTNPVTRHPAVAASAVATLGELAPGRTIFAIGSGDSAVLNLGERPARLRELREYLAAMGGLLCDGEASYRGNELNMSWAGHQIPIYMAAEGPRTLQLAGEIADGVIVNLGLDERLVHEALAHIRTGASKANRDPTEIDVWALVRVNIGDDPATARDEIKMELASSAHHAFRFTFEGKHVPIDMADAIRRIQREYQPGEHEHIGGANAGLLADPTLVEYLAERFAIVGPVDVCAARLRRLGNSGISNALFTGFVRDRARLIRTLGQDVLPLVNTPVA
jgi:5,10-methylenetetrahydromethanopterin reductase